jgi:ABC-type glycerol-3-phosphate transport system permease component
LALAQTFTTSFAVERLYRIQLSIRGDDSWHPMRVFIEKGGNLYRSVRVLPMGDVDWMLYTFQEPGPDDLTNKIRTWVNLEKIDSSPNYERDPHKIRVLLEFGSVSLARAWYYKVRRNYLLAFDNMPFWRYVATSSFLVILNLIGTLLSCSLVAFSFARLRWPGRNIGFGMMLATMMVPGQVTMIPFFLIIRYLGWYNTLTPLWACSFFSGAFNVFLLYQFFKGIPTDLEDAAKIDGCGSLRIYWLIMMPLLKPALATISIFTFMGVWNDFMGPLIFLNDQRLYPLSLGLYALNVQAGASMSLMMAGAILMVLPVLLLFFFAQRYFIEGITMTGIKG